jgi:hypothetical protein
VLHLIPARRLGAVNENCELCAPAMTSMVLGAPFTWG